MKYKTLVLSAALAFAALNSRAFELQIQRDTNSLPPLSTNLFILYGDVSGTFTNGQLAINSATGEPEIDCSQTRGAFCAVGGFFTNTTAGASNVNFVIAQSVDLKNWTNSLNLTLSIPPNSTNWATTQVTLPNAFPYYALREERNTNSANISVQPGTAFFELIPRPHRTTTQ